ncbi:MAG: hypothetical protein R2761_18890 [Acidimicrobiales bacterium]
MMHRHHRDRPGVHLTTEERRRFSEIALQLRYELDGLNFPDQVDDNHRPADRRRVRAALARTARRATKILVGLSRRLVSPFGLALIGLGAVIGAAMTAGDLRFALMTAGSFTLAWATTTAALHFTRHRYARRVAARRQHLTSP